MCLGFRPTCVLSLLIGWYGNSFALCIVSCILAVSVVFGNEIVLFCIY